MMKEAALNFLITLKSSNQSTSLQIPTLIPSGARMAPLLDSIPASLLESVKNQAPLSKESHD